MQSSTMLRPGNAEHSLRRSSGRGTQNSEMTMSFNGVRYRYRSAFTVLRSEFCIPPSSASPRETVLCISPW